MSKCAIHTLGQAVGPRPFVRARRSFNQFALALVLLTLNADAGAPLPGSYPQYVVPAVGDDAWHGRLRAVAFTAVSGASGMPPPADAWEADALLSGSAGHTARPPGSRSILTARDSGSSGSRLAHIALRTETLSPAQLLPFQHSPDGTVDHLHAARLAYLLGHRHLEGTSDWRIRRGVLGAMRGATPLVVGAPQMLFTSGTQYAFARLQQRRTPVVYIGTNNGMLHAFNLADGQERFAYAPAALLPWLATVPHRRAQLRPPVCPRPAAADAELLGEWRTVLVCSTGAATAGWFSMDITNPDVDDGHGLRWEVDSKDLPLLGHLAGPAAIIGLTVQPVAGPANADGRRWFMVTGNGVPDASPTSSSAPEPSLLLLALDHRHGQSWREGRDYWRLPTPPGTRGSLGAPVIVRDVLGRPITAYAGDTSGTLWRFDLRGALPWDDIEARATALLSATSRQGQPLNLANAPLLLHGIGGPLVLAVGTPREGAEQEGSTLFAVRDTGLVTRERAHLPDAAQENANRDQSPGWRMDLPHVVNHPLVIEAIGHGYIRLVTHREDGEAQQHLLDALSGRTAGSEGQMTEAIGPSIFLMPLLTSSPTGPTLTSTQGSRHTPWQFHTWTATDTTQEAWHHTKSATFTVRSGRLAWRELPMEPP
jgi:type IV pilus assembly protein PilY1